MNAFLRFSFLTVVVGFAGCAEQGSENEVNSLKVDYEDQTSEDTSTESDTTDTSQPREEETEEETDTEDEADCGPLSHEAGTSCECDEGYSKYSDDWADGCWADGVTNFRITIGQVRVIPFKMDKEKPWDWTSWVSGTLEDAIAVFNQNLGSEELDEWSEIEEYTRTNTPEVIDGDRAPDLYIELEVDDEFIWETEDTIDEVIEHDFDETGVVSVNGDQELHVRAYDSDSIDDDYIGGVFFTLEQLQFWAGTVNYAYSGGNELWTVEVQIEPIFAD